jgi:hypothetical protein
MKAWNMICVTLVASLGCGGGGAKTTATTPGSGGAKAKGEAKVMTEAQLKLGHFATTDGMHGFVLDRTGAKAKLMIDGQKDIIELTMEEDRDGGELRGYSFVGPDNKKYIYVSKGGSLLYYKDGDEFWASFDKEADALGKPTMAGAPVKEKGRYEIRGAALTPIAVRTKFPAFKPEDSANLAKVTEAFEKADASMFVRYKSVGKDGWQPHLTVTPDSISGIGYGRQDNVTDEDEAKRHTKLAKHGGVIAGFSSAESAQGNHIIVTRSEGSSDVLPDGMPGLIWEINDTTAVFVSLDGGRYQIDINQEADPIEKGAGAEAGWPKPVTDTYVDLTMISALAKAGNGGDKTVADLEKIDGEWNACVVKGWKGAQAKIDTGKLSVGQVKAEIKKLHKGCNKHLDAFEAAIVKYAEERAKARQALYAKASAKAKAAK